MDTCPPLAISYESRSRRRCQRVGGPLGSLGWICKGAGLFTTIQSSASSKMVKVASLRMMELLTISQRGNGQLAAVNDRLRILGVITIIEVPPFPCDLREPGLLHGALQNLQIFRHDRVGTLITGAGVF